MTNEEQKQRMEVADATVERLRKSQEDGENEDRSAGHAAGVLWAKKYAEHKELVAMAEIDPTDWPEPEEVANALGQDAYGFWEQDCDIVDGPSDPLPSLDYTRGFIEGALEVYEAVKTKL